MQAQQGIHWVQLTAQNNINTTTIIVLPDNNWYTNNTTRIGPFLDAHVIAHFPPHTITYKEPTIPSFLTIAPQIEPQALHTFRIHHKNIPIGA